MSIPTQSAAGGDDPLLSPVADTPDVLFRDSTGTKTKALRLDASGNVPISGTISQTLLDNFGRIKNKQFKDTETVLYDIPLVPANSFAYVGVAPKGSSQSATVWNIIRTSFDANGNPSADQIALSIAWSARATGPWT